MACKNVSYQLNISFQQWTLNVIFIFHTLFASSAKKPKMTEASSSSTPDELLLMSGGIKTPEKNLFSFNSFLTVYKGCELNW